MTLPNLAVKLCGILQSQTTEAITAREWRLIGQEQDGSQLLSWVSTSSNNEEVLHIGVYHNKTKALSVLHTFDERINIIQASVNASHSLLVYVVKEVASEDNEVSEPGLYYPYLLPLLPGKEEKPIAVEEGSPRQTMVQYVYGKSYKYSPGVRNDLFLLFKHLEYIKIYRTTMISTDCDDGSEEWDFDGELPEPETIVRVFSWAQWDCTNQAAYYIHYRAPAAHFAEEEEAAGGGAARSPAEAAPVLSALQFHCGAPHETVLNIPLSLPQLPSSPPGSGAAGGAGGAGCGAYSDCAVPLRVHDCSLDLLIVCDDAGILCIAHHYLYKPLDESTSSLALEDGAGGGVNFAYSVTLLHHGCVVHGVVPDLPWCTARSLRPSFTLHGDHQLLVTIPRLFTHVLDVSPAHSPRTHVLLPGDVARGAAPGDVTRGAAPGDVAQGAALAPLLGWGPSAMVDLNTLDIVTLGVSEKDLVATFKSDTALENRLGVLHYLIMHEGNLELAEELISHLCGRGSARDAPGGWARAAQEYLVAAAHAQTRRALAPAALQYMQLLPFTHTHTNELVVKVGAVSVSVHSESLYNSAAAVLAPRARLRRFSEDVWTRLWAARNTPAPARRLQLAEHAQRLRTNMQQYKPEALSRCTTPLSPCGGGFGGAAPLLLLTSQRRACALQDALPFVELDNCTATRQEHVLAANMREVSLQLMRGRPGDADASGAIHCVSARWAAAQLDASRAVCRAVCKAAAATPHHHQPRGFAFIDELDPAHASYLFHLLAQYHLAVDSIAFPLPQGFASFFSYLGWRALPPHMFMQHVHRGLLELHIDVLKAIVTANDDDQQTVDQKLRLIQLVGEGRARRVLAAWPHKASLILRARDHAHTLLSGEQRSYRDRARPLQGFATLPSGSRLSPLDTFLDLLTAKASLNELDFNLIIQATLVSMQPDKLSSH